MARVHRFESHKQEIADLLAEGKTFREVEDYLFDKYMLNAPESELSTWCKANGIKNLITNGRHSDSVPHCMGCPDYMEIGTNHISNRISNIRVCKAVLEVIPNNVASSPCWCCKRN